MLRRIWTCQAFVGCLTVLLSVLAAHDLRAQEPIVGAVVSRDDGQPVPNAVVVIDDTASTATTNATGRFRLERPTTGPTTGPATLVVRAQGFITHQLRVPENQLPGSSLTIELERTPYFTDQVQVTATKTDVAVGEVAAQTDIISRAIIDSKGDQTLAQAINHVPGAVVSTQLGIFESVLLRGMPRGDPEFTNVLLLVDGVPQTLSSNGSRVVGLPINDANSIEVMRGPNSAMYGRTAIGGSVNVRTADPTVDPQYGVDFTGGEFGMVKGVAKASGPVKQWGGYYVSAAAQQDHGYWDNLTTDHYEEGNWALFGKFTFTPDAKSFGSVSINRVVSDNNTPTNEPIVNGDYLHKIDPQFIRLENFNIPGIKYHQGETRFTFNYMRDITPIVKVVETLGYHDAQQKFIEDGDFIASPYSLENQTASMYPFSQDQNENIWYQELRVEVKPKTRIKQSAALGWSYEHNSGTLFSDFIDNDPDLGGFTINYVHPVIPPQSEWNHFTGNRVYHLGVTGIFGIYTIEPLSRLILSGGGRYDRLALDNTRNAGAKLEDTFGAFSPKVSATVKLMGADGGDKPTLNAYGTYSQAFLPPRRPSALTPADVPLNLQPENISNYEAGLKGSLAGGHVSLEATYFYMTEDGVVLSTRQGPFFLPTNAGQLNYKGFETGMGVILSPKVSFFVNASFYQNRFGDFVIQSEDGDEVLNGNRLPISPDHVVNWGATFTPVRSVQATFDVKHMGAVQSNNENTFELDSYTTVDAAVSWRKGPARVTLSAHNLFNSEYYWNSDGETADPGRPRQVLVTVSFLGKR